MPPTTIGLVFGSRISSQTASKFGLSRSGLSVYVMLLLIYVQTPAPLRFLSRRTIV